MQVQADPALDDRAQGHGLAARISVNRAGKVAVRPDRAMLTWPDSRGWRSASRTSRSNSGASSRNRQPWWASEAAPGRMMPLPPPTIAALVAVWCGAQNGGSMISGWRGGRRPATEWMELTSRASASSSGGKIVGNRSASMVLPTPGGPRSSR